LSGLVAHFCTVICISVVILHPVEGHKTDRNMTVKNNDSLLTMFIYVLLLFRYVTFLTFVGAW